MAAGLWLLAASLFVGFLSVFATEGVLFLDFEGDKLLPSALQIPPFPLGPSFTIEGEHCRALFDKQTTDEL